MSCPWILYIYIYIYVTLYYSIRIYVALKIFDFYKNIIYLHLDRQIIIVLSIILYYNIPVDFSTRRRIVINYSY